MPDLLISTIVRDLATAAGLVLAGAWAIWKWRIEETLRRQRDCPAPDGTMNAQAVPLDSNHDVVTLEALWRNRGNFSITLDVEHTIVEVFEIELSTDLGRLNSALRRGEPLFRVRPFGAYIMEPSTDSVMQEHFVLPKDGVYLFRWTIGLQKGAIPGSEDIHPIVCTRELVWRSERFNTEIPEKEGALEEAASS